MIELRALQMFLLLAEELHFGRTAEALGIAQSALSNQIRRIEDKIGARLFERGRRSAVSMTPAGHTFLAEAKATIAQAQRAEDIGRMAGRGEAGHARIGFVLSAALSGVLSGSLGYVRRELPLMKIDAEPMETPEQIDGIAHGRLDVGFIRPRAVYPPGIEVQVVHKEGLLIAMCSGHALADKDRILAQDLASETFISPQFNDTDGFAETIVRLSTVGGFDAAPAMRTCDFVTATALAGAGYGMVLAPVCMAHIHRRDVVFRRIHDFDFEVQIVLAWNLKANLRLVETLLDGCGRTFGGV